MPTIRLSSFALAIAGSLFLSAAAHATDGNNRVVDIINDTSVTMTEFYASNIDRTDWEEDILDGDYLRPGSEVSVDIDDGSGYCLFDLKAVFADGESVTQKRFDVCTEPSWRVVD